MKKLSILLVLTVLGACANTRDPNPISMKDPGDLKLTCALIKTEYKANTNAATYKISKNKSDDGQDILLGALIWPGLADFKNADGVEGNALLDRNLYLLALAGTNTCSTKNWPNQPSRYN